MNMFGIEDWRAFDASYEDITPYRTAKAANID